MERAYRHSMQIQKRLNMRPSYDCIWQLIRGACVDLESIQADLNRLALYQDMRVRPKHTSDQQRSKIDILATV